MRSAAARIQGEDVALRHIARRRAEQREQGEGAQAGDAALALLGFPLLALDADQRAEQNGGGEIERKVEQLLIFHRLRLFGPTHDASCPDDPGTMPLRLGKRKC